MSNEMKLTEEAIKESLGRMLYRFAIEAQEKHDPPAPTHRFEAIPAEQKAALIETATLFADQLCPGHAGLRSLVARAIRIADDIDCVPDEMVLAFIADAKAALAQAEGGTRDA